MTPPDQFRAALARLGLSQRAFARAIGGLANRAPQYRTVERWCSDRDAPDAAWALLAAIERTPELASLSDTPAIGHQSRHRAV